MKTTFAAFVAWYFLFFAAVIIALGIYPKGDLHLLLNSYHAPFEDCLFACFTRLAEFPLYLVALLPLLFWKPGWTYLYAASEITCALTVCAVKHCCDMPRPIAFFEHSGIALPLVDGVRMCCRHSFPSGHTSTFFVFATTAALLVAYEHSAQGKDGKSVRSALLTTALFFFALLGGYSRIYLSQHFLSDVLCGSLIGFLTPCFLFGLFYKMQWTQKDWFNQCLLPRGRGRRKTAF